MIEIRDWRKCKEHDEKGAGDTYAEPTLQGSFGDEAHVVEGTCNALAVGRQAYAHVCNTVAWGADATTEGLERGEVRFRGHEAKVRFMSDGRVLIDDQIVGKVQPKLTDTLYQVLRDHMLSESTIAEDISTSNDHMLIRMKVAEEKAIKAEERANEAEATAMLWGQRTLASTERADEAERVKALSEADAKEAREDAARYKSTASEMKAALAEWAAGAHAAMSDHEAKVVEYASVRDAATARAEKAEQEALAWGQMVMALRAEVDRVRRKLSETTAPPVFSCDGTCEHTHAAKQESEARVRSVESESSALKTIVLSLREERDKALEALEQERSRSGEDSTSKAMLRKLKYDNQALEKKLAEALAKIPS